MMIVFHIFALYTLICRFSSYVDDATDAAIYADEFSFFAPPSITPPLPLSPLLSLRLPYTSRVVVTSATLR